MNSFSLFPFETRSRSVWHFFQIEGRGGRHFSEQCGAPNDAIPGDRSGDGSGAQRRLINSREN
jgi:hypothetical protein